MRLILTIFFGLCFAPVSAQDKLFDVFTACDNAVEPTIVAQAQAEDDPHRELQIVTQQIVMACAGKFMEWCNKQTDPSSCLTRVGDFYLDDAMASRAEVGEITGSSPFVTQRLQKRVSMRRVDVLAQVARDCADETVLEFSKPQHAHFPNFSLEDICRYTRMSGDYMETLSHRKLGYEQGLLQPE